jgi:hypothetical protein
LASSSNTNFALEKAEPEFGDENFESFRIGLNLDIYSVKQNKKGT